MNSWALFFAILILVINLIVSVIYMIYNFLIRRRFHKAVAGLVMIICPIIGPLYFLCAYLIFKFDFRKKLIYDDDINFSKSKVENIMFPDYDKEIQTVPFEEVLIVSNNEDKRRTLLDNLKNDFAKSLGTISKALDDDDVETSHYAATAIMNATGDFLVSLKGLDDEYQKNKGDYEINRQYADYVKEYLNSGILDEVNYKRYGYLYVDLIENIQINHSEMLYSIDIAYAVDVLIHIKDYALAEQWALKGINFYETNERSYLSLLRTYYETGQDKKFFKTLEELKMSDISLSQKGVEFVRFFTSQGSVTV